MTIISGTNNAFLYMNQLYIIRMMHRLVKFKVFKLYKKLKLKLLKLLVLDNHNHTGCIIDKTM
jgi:hypothetical protein